MRYKGYRYCLIAAALLLFAATGSFAQNAKVRVIVKPNQAYIFVDGTPFGDSSRTISVSPGDHTITVHNYGYKTEVRQVSLNPGKNADLNFELVAVEGTVSGPWGRIQIEGAPRAAIYLNGKTPEYFVGHGDEFDNSGALFACCTQELIVPVGTHEVTVVNQGSQELWSGSVKVLADERVILYVPSGKQKTKPWHGGAAIDSLGRFKAGVASATIAIPPVSGNISATPANINCGDSTSVSWQTSETVQRTITADSETLKQVDPSGNLSVQPKSATTYHLVASGPGGSVASSAPVDVNSTIQSSIDASPAQLHYRRIGDKVLEQGSANLGWTATNASSVSIDPLGSVATSGTQSVPATPKQETNGPVDEVKTFTLNAKNDCGGSDTHTVSIHVTGSIEPVPDVSLVSVFFPTGYPDSRHPQEGLVQSQKQSLDRTAEGFKKYLEYDPDANLTVAGNADERDSNAKNKPLSERRASLVKQYLVSQGIPDSKIETVAYGDTKQLDASTVASLHDQNPNKLAGNVSPQALGWAYNRRVDIALLPKDVRSTQYFPGDAPDAKILADSNWPGQKEVVTLAAEKSKIPDDQAPAH
jgi:peptidoglycan-associated lipoprotein